MDILSGTLSPSTAAASATDPAQARIEKESAKLNGAATAKIPETEPVRRLSEEERRRLQEQSDRWFDRREKSVCAAEIPESWIDCCILRPTACKACDCDIRLPAVGHLRYA